jgi:hypothetical protein
MAGTTRRAPEAEAPEATAPEGGSAELTPDEEAKIRESDSRDVSPRREKVTGKRVRAIPSVITKSNDRSTTVQVRRSDFKMHGINHPTVTFDFRNQNCSLPVGKPGGLTEEAAEFLTSEFPTSYEYLSE